MQMPDLAPTVSDVEIPYSMAPWLDFNFDWILIRKTPAKNVGSAKEDLKRQQGSNLDSRRQIEDVDLLTLNQEQRFASNSIQQNMDSQKIFIIVGG